MVLLAPAYAIPGLASFVSVPLLFAALGPAEYGRWALLYGIAAGVPQFTTSWLEQRLIRFGHRAGRSADGRRVAVAIGASICASLLLAVALVPNAAALDLIAAATLTSLVSSYVLLIARFQASLAFGAISAAAMVRAVLGSGLGIAAGVLTGRASMAILGLAAGYLVGELMGVRERSRSMGRSVAGPELSTIGAGGDASPPERASYGVASAVAAVAAYELSVGDRFIIAALRPLADVGRYAATYSLVDLVGRFVPSVVLGAMRPRLFRAWDAGSRSEVSRVTGSAAILMIWVVATLVALLAAAGRILSWLPVDPALLWPIGVGFASFMASNTVAIAYSAATRQVRLAAHVATASMANVALNLMLIPILGAYGAAMATALSYGLLFGLNVSSIGEGWFTIAQLSIALPAVGTFAALSLATTSGSGPWLLVAMVAAALGAVPAAREFAAIRQMRSE